jgi:hypothetical protein
MMVHLGLKFHEAQINRAIMENLIYWKTIPVGIDNGNSITWFSNATAEIVKELSKKCH